MESWFDYNNENDWNENDMGDEAVSHDSGEDTPETGGGGAVTEGRPAAGDPEWGGPGVPQGLGASWRFLKVSLHAGTGQQRMSSITTPYK